MPRSGKCRSTSFLWFETPTGEAAQPMHRKKPLPRRALGLPQKLLAHPRQRQALELVCLRHLHLCLVPARTVAAHPQLCQAQQVSPLRVVQAQAPVAQLAGAGRGAGVGVLASNPDGCPMLRTRTTPDPRLTKRTSQILTAKTKGQTARQVAPLVRVQRQQQAFQLMARLKTPTKPRLQVHGSPSRSPLPPPGPALPFLLWTFPRQAS